MFSHIKTQEENPGIPQSGFTLDQIMRLHISFHKLVLTRVSFRAKLLKWIALKKAKISPKDCDEKCFKWTVIASLLHEEIAKDPQRIFKIEKYEK